MLGALKTGGRQCKAGHVLLGALRTGGRQCKAGHVLLGAVKTGERQKTGSGLAWRFGNAGAGWFGNAGRLKTRRVSDVLVCVIVVT